MKATEHYLTVVLFIVLHKVHVVLTFESVNEILMQMKPIVCF